MPNIQLSDNFGFSIDATPNEGSSFIKYFKSLSKLRFAELDANQLKSTRLRDLPVKAFSAGISFQDPVDIGADSLKLKVGAGAGASLECALAEEGQTTHLFESDLFGDPIEIPAGGAYVSFGLTASVGLGLSGTEGNRNNPAFGAEAGRELALKHHHRFDAADVNFREAIETTLRSFVIPADRDDLQAMAEGSIATVETTGTLRFSGTVNLLGVTNPLFDASIPGGFGKLSLAAGTSIDVGASFELQGRYQIRAHKVTPTICRIGLYRDRSHEFGIRVSAKAGLAMKVGDSELIARVLQIVSPNPEADQKELEGIGLNESQVAAIDAAIKAGLERSLAVAVGIELGAASSDAAAFLYQVDLDKLDARGSAAIQRMLRGDLADLTETTDAPLPGIAVRKSIFTSMRKRRHALKVNLLGIYNFISISTLVRNGVVLHDPLTGELTISDSVTAERIRASMNNFETKTEKLREALAERFLITALYRSTGLVTGPPSLRSSHSYFERHARTNRQTMKDNLDAAEAMKLLPAEKKKTALGQIDDFGSSLLLIDTSYDDSIARNLFLKNGKPRTEEDYDRAGRQALERLVQAGETDDYRRKPATDDALWTKMTNVGQPGFAQLFPGLNMVQLEVIRSDYTVIKWWSETMRRMALELERVDRFLASNPQADLRGKEFQSIRERLAKALLGVAKNVKKQFGDPWGLLAMDITAGQQADARFRLSCPRLSLDLSRDREARQLFD